MVYVIRSLLWLLGHLVWVFDLDLSMKYLLLYKLRKMKYNLPLKYLTSHQEERTHMIHFVTRKVTNKNE